MKHFSSFKKGTIVAFFMLAISLLSPNLTASALTIDETVAQQEKNMGVMEQLMEEAEQMEVKVSELKEDNLANMQKAQENPTATTTTVTTISDSYQAALDEIEAGRKRSSEMEKEIDQFAAQVEKDLETHESEFEEKKKQNDKIVAPVSRFLSKVGFFGFFIIVLISSLLGIFVRCCIQYKTRKWLMKEKDSSSKTTSANNPVSNPSSNSTATSTTNSSSKPLSNSSSTSNSTPHSSPAPASNPTASNHGRGGAVMS